MSEFESLYLPSSGQAKCLLIFLHGYNNTRAEMLPAYTYLQHKMPGLAIAAPEGNSRSSRNPEHKRWYKIQNFDINGMRKLESTPIEEIAKLYNQAGSLLAQTAQSLNNFIDETQKQYGFNDSNTYIAGFSQGAMVAIWTALIRKRALTGCFSFSGLAAADVELDKQIASRPKVYLLHGKQDKQVLFKCLNFTAEWLKSEQVPVTAKSFADLGHEISEPELDFTAEVMSGAQA